MINAKTYSKRKIMTKEEKLLTLLQPSDYKSKIKLFCREKELKSSNLIEKYSDLVANDKRSHYICIQEIK